MPGGLKPQPMHPWGWADRIMLTASSHMHQGFVESMKLILGGSMSRVGALSECPFQGDESIHSAGNGLGSFWGHLCGPWHKEVGGVTARRDVPVPCCPVSPHRWEL